MMSDCKRLTECVACGSNKLKLVLDLSKQPLANSYKLKKDDWQPEFPLAINRCEECYHVQLTHAVDPALMFEDYLYVSGTTQTGHKHFEDFATLTNNIHGKAKSILDVGCNDGTQLDYFKKLGLETYGVDPAKNLWSESTSKNHFVWCDYFNDNFVGRLVENTTFDIITAQNVFAHTADPIEFLRTAKRVMDDDSLLFIQTSQANMILNNEFDTIYHEHISFFNAQSMQKLCERADLYLVNIDKMPIHGTSYIFTISKKERKGNVDFVIAEEEKNGLYNPETYVKYAKRCDQIVDELVQTVCQYTRNDVGWLAVGYGAPAKGMTLLNYSGLQLDFIIDDNPLKQGRFTPGSSIPIVSSAELEKYKDALVFVPLAWNFYDEIVSKIKKLREDNPNKVYDRYITYFPSVVTSS
jgi:2-polyprenyl-3-methyl-5-hydroxy-6-metoxy-1,4-benzoquinol methylase